LKPEQIVLGTGWFSHGEIIWPAKIARELVEKFAFMYGTRRIKKYARHRGIGFFQSNENIHEEITWK